MTRDASYPSFAGLERVPVGVADADDAGDRVEAGQPSLFVHDHIVGAAQKDHVPQCGWAVEHPVLDVVCVCPFWRAVALGEAAAAVSVYQCAS